MVIVRCCKCHIYYYWYSTHTHTHPFNGPFSRTTRVGRYQKGKTNLDFTDTAMSPNLLEMVFREALSRESLILVGYGLVFTFLVLAWKRGCQMVLVVITCWHLYSALLLCVFAVFQSWPREPALLFGTPLHSYRLWQWRSWSCIHCWGSTVFCWWHMLAM